MKIDKAESNQDQDEVEKHKDSIKNTSIYSCYFEFQLDQADLGRSRKEHNEICNRALLIQLELLRKENIQLVEGISNNDLLIHMGRYPQKPPDDSLTWEHCPSTTVIDGRLGVMRLVSSSQHSSKSEYWRAFHPDYKNRGGYHEWAFPAGAPDDDYTKVKKNFNYQAITVEELPHYFEKTVLSNCYQDFCKVFSRAQQLLTPSQITRMLSRCYPMGKSERLNTLLHKAVKNGHHPLINSLLKCGEPVHHLLQIRNHRGNTVAHNAAEHNRAVILKELKNLGADLSVKNKRNKTVEDIVTSRNFVACLPFSKSSTNQEDQHSSDEEQGGGSDTIKDPQLAYGNIGGSGGGKSNHTLKSDQVHSKKHVESLKNGSYQNTKAVKKLPITDQEIKAIIKAQRALQERKKQKIIEKKSHRQQKVQQKHLLQERIRLFETRHSATQKPQQAQSRNQQRSEVVVRQKISEPVRQNVQRQRFFSQQESRRPTNPGSMQSIPYQPKPQMTFFQQQRPPSQLIKQSQKPNSQSVQPQKRQQSTIIQNRTAQQNQQRTKKSQQQMQKAQQQRVFLSSQFRPKQPTQQRPAQSTQQLIVQRNQQQSQQRNQQQAQQRTQQQAAQQRAQQQTQQRAQQQAAQQRAQQQAQQRAQQQGAQQRAQQQAQQRAQQQAAQQRAQQQAQQQAQQRAQQQAAQQRAQQQAQQRAQQQAAQQRAQQQAQQRSTYQRK